jgi:ABC-2 type transport system permease protein
MINALRSEWLKVRSTRGNLIIVIFLALAPAIIAGLISKFADLSPDEDNVFTDIVLGPSMMAAYLGGVLGALTIGQEYRHNTIRVTFTAQPRRSIVIAAKVVIVAVTGVLLTAAATFLSFLVSKAMLATRDDMPKLSLSEPSGNKTMLIGILLFAALFSLFGFGLCCLIRQPTAAIPIMLLWPLMIEPIFQVIPGAGKWLPTQNGFRMVFLDENEPNFADGFSRVGSGLYFAAFVAVVVAAGWFVAQRRDA